MEKYDKNGRTLKRIAEDEKAKEVRVCESLRSA